LHYASLVAKWEGQDWKLTLFVGVEHLLTAIKTICGHMVTAMSFTGS
jgi:hypothetical protein